MGYLNEDGLKHLWSKINSAIQKIINKVDDYYSKIEDIAKGAQIAVAFDDYKALISHLNSCDKDKYGIGQNFYIRQLNVPDVWVNYIQEVPSEYSYRSDEEFIIQLGKPAGIQVGNYFLSQLETQKVDLSNYVQKTRTVAGLDLKKDITTDELATEMVGNETLAQGLASNRLFYDKLAHNSDFCTVLGSNSGLGVCLGNNSDMTGALANSFNFAQSLASNAAMYSTLAGMSEFGRILADNYYLGNSFASNSTFVYALATNSVFGNCFVSNTGFRNTLASDSALLFSIGGNYNLASALGSNSYFINNLKNWQNIRSIPSYSTGDAGKVLTVTSGGNLSWVAK